MGSKKQFWLGAVATTTLVLYLLLALRYPLGPSLADPRSSWARMVDATWINAALHIAIYLGLTLLNMVAVHLLAPSQEVSKPIARRQIVLVLVSWLVYSGVLMAVAPAGESHDIFDYLFRGRMMAEYQANPLADVPQSYGTAPYIRYLAWRTNVDTYGPVWESTSAAVSIGVRQVANWLEWWDKIRPVCPRSTESCWLLMLYISAYRWLAISLTGLSGWFIASMVGHSSHPLSTPRALAVWWINPLTLIVTAVGGHNDAVMLVLVVLSWWLLQRQRPFLGFMALILAAHVKLTALIWLPAFALWIVWRLGWRRALMIGLATVASGLILSWILYLPFGGWQTLSRMLPERSAFLANSAWHILKQLLIDTWGWSAESAHQLSVGLPGLMFGVGALLIPLWMFNFRPKRWCSPPVAAEDVDSIFWRALVATSVLYLLVGAFWFQHWYVLWVLAPAALLPESQFTRSMLPWLAFGALSSNVAMDFLLNTLITPLPPMLGKISPVLMIWGPVSIAAIVLALSRFRRRLHPTETGK